MIRVAVALILNKEKNKILIGRRAPTEPHSGIWEFPGGKLEKGETVQEALKRELMEELNVKSTIGVHFNDYSRIYKACAYNLFTYFTEIDESTMKMRVHDKIEWVSFKEAHNFNMFPSNIIILDEMCKHLEL